MGLARRDPEATGPVPEALTQFVGRAGELARLEERLAEVEQGRGQVVVISGDPGIGKSRLLSEFRRRAGKRPRQCGRDRR